MSEPLHDLSPSALIVAIEDSLSAIIPAFAKWPQAEVYDGDEIKWSFTNIPSPLFNNVYCARLVPQQVNAAVDSMIGRAVARQVPVSWYTGPQTQPTDLAERLEEHGFVRVADEAGMAADLAQVNEAVHVPPGFGIEQVSGVEALRAFCRVCIDGFGIPPFVAEPLLDFLLHTDLGVSIPYMGVLNGEPIATSLLVLAAGVAGIYNVTTLPAARRRGIGAAMTLKPLLDARAMGYRVGVLQASEMGTGVYRRLGFQEYCRIRQYLWTPTWSGEPCDRGHRPVDRQGLPDLRPDRGVELFSPHSCSPLVQALSTLGGWFRAELKVAGFDALAVRGRDARESQLALRKRLGRQAQILTPGPAKDMTGDLGLRLSAAVTGTA